MRIQLPLLKTQQVSIDVLANDDNTAKLSNNSLVIGTAPTNGTASVLRVADAATGLTTPIVLYTPDADFNGTDTFSYTVKDINGDEYTATVMVTVTAVADIVVDSFTTDEDVTLNGNVLTNDTFEATTTPTISLGTDVTKGNLTLNADGTFTYIPNADFNGSDSFTYIATSNHTGSSTTEGPTTVTITVNPVNDASILTHL